jgi:hypothetical protein
MYRRAGVGAFGFAVVGIVAVGVVHGGSRRAGARRCRLSAPDPSDGASSTINTERGRRLSALIRQHSATCPSGNAA